MEGKKGKGVNGSSQAWAAPPPPPPVGCTFHSHPRDDKSFCPKRCRMPQRAYAVSLSAKTVTETVLNNGWRLVVDGGWRFAADGGWWRMAVGSLWRMVVGCWWPLVVGGWWSLGAVRKGFPQQKKGGGGFLKTPLGVGTILQLLKLVPNCFSNRQYALLRSPLKHPFSPAPLPPQHIPGNRLGQKMEMALTWGPNGGHWG